MKATVKIEKSFDEIRQFSKVYNTGDFLEFFSEEGKYLDKLANTVNEHGKPDEGFTMTYIVTISK